MKDKYFGFSKVDSRGYSYVTTTIFNPFTLEVISGVTYDADDSRNENEALSKVGICDDAVKLYKHFKGIIQIGDLVKINRGRKFKGETKRVTKKFTYKIDGMYGRSYGDVEYLVFEDGTKVAEQNCDLVQDYEAFFEKITGKKREYYLNKFFNESEEN